MSETFFVRTGALGHVGRFRCADRLVVDRDARVICRTRRGLEVGQVLSASIDATQIDQTDGTLLRRVTTEDDLLLARLEKNRHDAYLACVHLLEERQLDVQLMDVEHLFDGQSLYFYFLGELTAEIEQVTSELAETYETKVQFREFTDAVTRGCGPDCGTESAAGCGDGCASCSIASACAKSSREFNRD